MAKNYGFIPGQRSTHKAAQAHIWNNSLPTFLCTTLSLSDCILPRKNIYQLCKTSFSQVKSSKSLHEAVHLEGSPAALPAVFITWFATSTPYSMVKDHFHAEGENSSFSIIRSSGTPHSLRLTEALAQRRL